MTLVLSMSINQDGKSRGPKNWYNFVRTYYLFLKITCLIAHTINIELLLIN